MAITKMEKRLEINLIKSINGKYKFKKCPKMKRNPDQGKRRETEVIRIKKESGTIKNETVKESGIERGRESGKEKRKIREKERKIAGEVEVGAEIRKDIEDLHLHQKSDTLRNILLGNPISRSINSITEITRSLNRRVNKNLHKKATINLNIMEDRITLRKTHQLLW